MNVKFTRLLAFFILFAGNASAKVWRVNSTAGVSADFNSLITAFASASVLAGDTLYVESSATNYGNVTLTKRLVLIGGGYFLSGASGNTGLQFNNQGTSAVQINCMAGSSGSTIIGIDTYIGLAPDTDDLTLKRCNAIVFQISETDPPNPTVKNLVISQCNLDLRLSSHVLENPSITNCIVGGTFTMQNITNGFVRNNTFKNVAPTIYNSYVSNNIFSNAATFVNCSIRYNISTGNTLPTDAALHNVNNVSATVLFLGTGSIDGQYRLQTSGTNPAIGGGEPINGVTPDCGAFGTADPYRLSGIPPMPTIYALTVPTSVPASATTLNVTVSTRSNN